MFKYIALLALVVPAILATEGVGPCRNGAYAPTVNVAGCDRTPCPVPLNSEANMQVQFVAPFDIDDFRPDVEAGVLGFYINYPLEGAVTVGCDNLEGGRCPISAGEDVIYNFVFPVGTNYPQIGVNIELGLYANNGTQLISCNRVDIQVTA